MIFKCTFTCTTTKKITGNKVRLSNSYQYIFRNYNSYKKTSLAEINKLFNKENEKLFNKEYEYVKKKNKKKTPLTVSFHIVASR